MKCRNSYFDCSTVAPEELSRMLPDINSEAELADAYAQISNRFMLIEDDGTDCLDARLAEDTWGQVMDELERRVTLLVSGSSCAILSSRMLTPFMARNGYSSGTGLWVRTA